MRADSQAAQGTLRLGLALKGDLRWTAVEIRDPLEAIRLRLDLSPVATVALGRALISAALLQRFLQTAPTNLQLVVEGDGPLGKIVAEVDETGSLRGTVEGAQTPISAAGDLSIADRVGSGTLRIERHSQSGSSTSRVELVSGEIGDDVAHYLQQSHQIHSAVLLGVMPRADGVKSAGGLLVEALPGCPEGGIARLEENIRALGGISSVVEQTGIRGLSERVFAGLELEPGERSTLVAACHCRRERIAAKLTALDRQELAAAIGDLSTVEVSCSFCGQIYTFERRELLDRQ